MTTRIAFLLQSIRAQGYAWREDDVRDRFGEWSRHISAAADEFDYWVGGPEVELGWESLIDLLDQNIDECSED
jgi:hypothetical protein